MRPSSPRTPGRRPSSSAGKSSNFGSARLDQLVPGLPEDAPSGINMILSYEEAARLQASLAAALAAIAQSESRPGKINMCLWTDTQRLVVMEDRGPAPRRSYGDDEEGGGDTEGQEERPRRSPRSEGGFSGRGGPRSSSGPRTSSGPRGGSGRTGGYGGSSRGGDDSGGSRRKSPFKRER